MRAVTGLAMLGLALALFGWWGVFTAAGGRHFDEMDGLIPFFAGVAGLALLAIAAIVALIAWRRRSRRASGTR